MNILIFVLTILLVISSISYQALERYRVGAQLRQSWDHYMRIDAPCQFNKVVDEQYRQLRRSKAAEEPSAEENEDTTKAPKESLGASVINFRFLVNPEYAEKFPAQAPLMLNLLKNLINFLYAQHPLYQQLLQTRPTILDELFAEVQQAQVERPTKQRITKVKQINQLLPQDTDLQMLWYQLLKDNPIDLASMRLLWSDLDEPCLQVSLLNYLSNSPAPQVRLFLAPRALLYAIFLNQATVLQVINKRMELYREVLNNKDAKEASDEFKSFCTQFGVEELLPILNFQVTKTNPRNYEE